MEKRRNIYEEEKIFLKQVLGDLKWGNKDSIKSNALWEEMVVKVKNQLNSFLFSGNMQLIIQLII